MPAPHLKTPMAGPNSDAMPVLKHNHEAGQRIAFSSASAASLAIDAHAVFLKATRDCYYRVGADPTAAAAAGSFPLTAGETQVIGITPGEKIAVIRDALDGYLFISPAVEVE